MDRGDRRLIFWWAVLLVLTLLSFESGVQWLDQAGIVTAIVIIIALVKIRVVILYFMEVSEAPLALRAPLELWVLALGAAILTLWYGVFA
ncbi:cytochrome C oxidase subunit IV family protein [Sphingobium aromaticiconvertens]|uniref:cytochrome C oxidase subunit IV family protein n=1 Tax=Sphingobium aromaticiconvertens TaxID=365341 RepID=UPI0030191FD5